jgi:PAS domain S-box-containing protein/putative nucleotidyltransferase with HDIG domain
MAVDDKGTQAVQALDTRERCVSSHHGEPGPERALDLAEGMTDVPVAAVGGVAPAFSAVTGQTLHDDLGESDGFFQRLFDGSPDGVVLIGPNGRVLAANPAQASMHGYRSPADLVGTSATLLVAPSCREDAAQVMARRLSGEAMPAVEHELVRSDGTTFYGEVSTTVLSRQDGAVSGYLCTTRDRTERKRAEAALRGNEQHYRELVNGAIEGIYRTSMEGRSLSANQAMARMLGYGSGAEMVAEVVDSTHQLWAAPEDRSRFTELLREQGFVRNHECQFLRKDGQRIWVSLNIKIVPGPDGGAAQYEGFVEDISERKRAEAALHERDLQFRAFVEQAPVAIGVSRHGAVLYANQRFADLVGRNSADGLVGGPTYEFFAPDEQEESRERARRRDLGLGPPPEYESVFMRADGSEFPVHVALGPVQLGDGPAIISFVTDITDRQAAEDALRAGKAMRDLTERVAKVGSWRWDIGSGRDTWSDGMFSLFDTAPGDLDGGAMAIVEKRVHRDDLGALVQARATALETGEPLVVELRVVHGDGTEHALHNEAIIEHDATGKAVAVTGYFQDVTDQYRAAARLEAAATEWSETFDAMADSVALLGADGRVMRCNAATVAIAGRDIDDIVGHHWHEVFHGADYVEAGPLSVFDTAQVKTEVIEQDGQWLRMYARPRLDHEGQVCGGVLVVTDITPLRQAEQVAKEHAHFLEQLLQAIPVPVFFKDTTLHFVGHNQAYAASVGRPTHEIVGKTIFDVRPPEVAAFCDTLDRHLLAHPEEVLDEELVLPGPDGAPRYTQSHAAAFLDTSGRPAGIVCVNLDITGVRQAEQQLVFAAGQLKVTLRGAVTALSTTTELRDPYTGGHQRRVAELACAIAGEIGWDEARTELLRTAALLHDVGKIVVPAEILAKPGRLSEVEMQLVRQHAAAGADIVGPIGFDPDVAEMIRQHHERQDGSGYPAGLRGDEILAGARILAVADVVEAMISHRPYRAALAVAEAVAELEDGAGGRYERPACRAAVSLVREQGFTFSEHAPRL